MTIPFLKFFKKAAPKDAFPVQPPPMPRVEKPSNERLSKTVMPNATRTLLPQEEFESVPPPASPRRSPGIMMGSGLPPAVALALEPTVERVISLELRDVVAQMPAGWTRPVSDVEGNRRVLLKAAEIEKGMSRGQPCVCLTSVYQQVPEIFVRPVLAAEETQVPLPFAKVLEQFGKLHTRNDQTQDKVVPQVETPFLRMTVEDNERMGIKTAPVHGSVVPPGVVQLATAETIAAAEPESFFKVAPRPTGTVPEISVTRAPDGSKAVIRLPVEESSHAPAIPAPLSRPDPAADAQSAPTRIPFKLSPIGTGAPASERVPASSGPSVPTSAVTPTRIPFKMAAPDEETPAAPAEVAPKKPEHQISLALKPILLALPPMQLKGDANSLGDEVRLDVPFSLVESQLSSGRISLQAAEFEAILPEQYRNLFSSKEINAPVALPLEDVLKNLPAASLRIRDDQEEQEKGGNFQTPFSAKAAEDAKRFGMAVASKPLKGQPQIGSKAATPESAKSAPVTEPKPDAPVAKIKMLEPVVPAAAPDAPVELEMAKPAEAPVAPKEPAKVESSKAVADATSDKPSPNGARNALQTAFDTDEDVDAKTVVAHVVKLAGVKGCAIMFNDGLGLAGNLPGEFQAEGLCALGPSFLKRLEDHMAATKLGSLRAVTLSCAKAAITFFMHDNLCLAALHAKEELAADVRERLARAVHELSEKYSHPA